MQLKFTPHLVNRKYGYFSYLAEIIALFAVYFSTAKLGLSMDAVSRFATLIWSPSGIAAAALLLFGYRLWPAIIIGAFLVNLLNGAPLFVAVGIGIGNTLEALVGNVIEVAIGVRIVQVAVLGEALDVVAALHLMQHR